jgi:hypothetical protein
LILNTIFSKCGSCVRIAHNSDVKILNCQFKDINYNPLYIQSNSATSIVNTIFSTCGSYVQIARNSDVKIVNCQFKDINDHPLYIQSNSATLILNTLFSKCNNHLRIGECSKIIVQSSAFENMNVNSIVVSESLSLSISNCVFTNCIGSIYFNRCNDLRIENCFLYNCKNGFCMNKCVGSLLRKTSFQNCDKCFSIFDESSVHCQSLIFEKCPIGMQCFPNSVLLLIKFLSQNSQFVLKQFSTFTVSKGTISDLILKYDSNIESNDVLKDSIIHSLFSIFVNPKCTIPPLCLLCQRPTKLSSFTACKHALYCCSCFYSKIINDTKYCIDSLFRCELCGSLSDANASLTLYKDPLTDSDCHCLCCHSHQYTQVCGHCQQIYCKRCFRYYGSVSYLCMNCDMTLFSRYYLSTLQIIPDEVDVSK